MVFIVIVGLGLQIGFDLLPVIRDSNSLESLQLGMENFLLFLLIGLLLLLITGIVNLIFIITPMKFPISPIERQNLKK